MKNFILILFFYFIISPIFAETKIPKYFYKNELPQCILKYGLEEISIENPIVKDKIEELVGFDWVKYHDKNSNSLTVKHDKISNPVMYLNSSIHNAVIKNNLNEIKTGIELLYKIAEKNTLLETPTVSQIKQLGSRCYGGNNNANAKCDWHKPQWVMIIAAHYIIASNYSKDFMNKEQKDRINSYIEILYKKYISPWANKEGEKGFNEMANGKIASIAYANWNDNYELAELSFKKGFNEIDNHFREDGYINNNSFRGSRALWYHSMGLNNALGLIALSNAWSITVPKKILMKVTNSAKVLNLGITDYKKFKSKQFFGKNYNSSTSSKTQRKHTHQNAIGIDFLMSKYLNINLSNDYEWFKKKQKFHNDIMIGFDANCLFVSKLFK